MFFKKLFVLNFIIIFLLVSCSKKKPDNFKEIRDYITNSCKVTKGYTNDDDIILATLYFNHNEYKLSTKDKEILNKVITSYEYCNNNILILSHASNDENKNNKAYKISYLRQKEVYSYLSKKIPNKSINRIFCSNNRNKFIEDNNKAKYGNQRVELVMLGSTSVTNFLVCFGEGNKK